ncbi:hypothetical protein [Cognatiluteimonas weifangensis]|uniref:Uncharacterized protein n=1 Tax=Cognatiluteimonas weifangensis TaxID=2303539 RepID=A0A372DQN8_9GAMM|nr:hypothetical protein [Luteimonas weifangensis]RFP61856.1 hypothetical protein D0Y53_01990 [Luteimonas weifangensis]
MRALFVGGPVDNSELDLEGRHPPMHYPENTGTGRPRYQLHHVGRNDGDVAYAVYAAPGLADAEVHRIADERGYARRFDATPVAP